jgi:autotransporter-associated beta strand protein
VAAGQTLTLNGLVSGTAGALLKTGTGTLVLASTANSYGGGTTVQQGGLQVAADGSLGVAGTPVTVSGAGTLTFTGSTTTARTFNVNSGTLTAPAGVALTLMANASAASPRAGTLPQLRLSARHDLHGTTVTQAGPGSHRHQ